MVSFQDRARRQIGEEAQVHAVGDETYGRPRSKLVGGGRSRAATRRAGRPPGAGSWTRRVRCRWLSSIACAAKPRVRPCRGRLSGRESGARRAARAPRRVWPCQRPWIWTTSADATAASRSVSGPLSLPSVRVRKGVQPRGCGRDDRHVAAQAGSGPRSFPGCSGPCRRRAPDPGRCRDGATRALGSRAIAGEGRWFGFARTHGVIPPSPDRDLGPELRVACHIEGLEHPRANRSGPQLIRLPSAARSPMACRSALGPLCQPCKLLGHLLDVRAGRIAAGSPLRFRDQRLRTAARDCDTSSGKPVAAASLTTRPQGSEILGRTKAAA